MKCILNMKPVVALALCTTLTAGIGVGAGVAATDTAQSASAPVMIQSLQMKGDGVGAELIVAASVPPTYTSYKTAAPQRLVVDFSQATPVDSLTEQKFDKGPVKGVTFKRFDTDAGVLTRMEIFLAQDVDPIITPSTDKIGELRISFPGFKPEVASSPAKQEAPSVVQAEIVPAPVVAKPEPVKDVAPSAAQENTVPVITDVVAQAGGIAIVTQTPILDFKTFRLNKPERIVVDILNAKLSMPNKLVQLNVAGVSTARVGSYPDKVRVVFDAINGVLPEASFDKTQTGLVVLFAAQNNEKQYAAATVTQSDKHAVAATVKEQAAPVPRDNVSNTTAQASTLDFQVMGDISRVTVKVTGSPKVEDPVKSPGSVSFRIKNALLPRNLQRSLETREFASPVLRVTPVQVKTKTGNDILIRVALKMDSGYELRHEADLVYLDIKHPSAIANSIESTKGATAQKASPLNGPNVASANDQIEKVAEQAAPAAGKTRYTGRKVTLEFADAEVRKIFQLLSEVSNKNFVLGDEVTGTISLKLVNVPWDQALDIILDTKGLDKREEGTIVLIRGKGKFKSLLDEELEIRKSTLRSEPLQTAMFDVNYADLGSIVSQFNSIKTDRGLITQDQRTNKVIVKDVKSAVDDMRKILASLDVPEKQVMIEARIVEASSTFTQSLGVNWGIHYRDGSAAIAGINSMDTNFGGLASTTPTTSGVSGSPGAAAGISFGTLSSNIKLDLRLNAAVSAGLVRIVSTPRVATLNHKSAKITQGQQIPYTASTSDKIETKFVEAALALEVTPHINPNGTVVMKIDAKNDSPGSTGNPPAINKKQATTEMMLRDGETTVIGGIFVESESNNDDGVPFLSDVPWLGGLFKSNETKRNRNELLIFITPRIINANS
ncbi:type IV pilus secretin PilQ [Trichlorobacter lovleyi]|uniref:type IV pilus secretin family protein n=1 Tax=Trichlorobacter lovleyi TaxID=313985 RepID=UPI00223F3A17|nr:type IV pilus secretin family protein [Trichlorobacter lovleyi]QOX78681.1 type IV pilus secretin PilQ [Trichlorobacter lovleyi]